MNGLVHWRLANTHAVKQQVMSCGTLVKNGWGQVVHRSTSEQNHVFKNFIFCIPTCSDWSRSWPSDNTAAHHITSCRSILVPWLFGHMLVCLGITKHLWLQQYPP
jgi:hypothetical protein